MLNFCNYTNAEKETVHADTALNAAYQNLSYLLEKKTHKAITCENTQNFQLYWWACPLEWAPRIREYEEILQGRASQAAGSAEPAMKKSKSFKDSRACASTCASAVLAETVDEVAGKPSGEDGVAAKLVEEIEEDRLVNTA